MTVEQRNAIVEQYINAVWWTIRKNRVLINSARLDVDDVYQNLVLRLIRAIEIYNPAKGNLTTHIFAQLQWEILDHKKGKRLYGMPGVPYNARRVLVSLDAMMDARGAL